MLVLSHGGYYAWGVREPSAGARANALLSVEIVEIHAMSGGTFRVQRVHAEPRARDRDVSATVMVPLMRSAGSGA